MSARCPGWGGGCTNYSGDDFGLCSECSAARDGAVPNRSARVQAQAPSGQGAQDIEPCSCDEALALRARVAELEEKVRILAQSGALEAEAKIKLRTELARTRFLSVLRGKLGRAWASRLDKVRAELGPLALACEAIPDITISKWACDPGGHWNPVRDALRARRAAQGLDVDAADPETAFDEHGWLKQRREVPR